MNANELREVHSRTIKEARQIYEQAENGNLNSEGQEKFDSLMAEADGYKNQIANAEKLEAYEAYAKESAGRVSEPREPQSEPIHKDIEQYSLLRAISFVADWCI